MNIDKIDEKKNERIERKTSFVFLTRKTLIATIAIEISAPEI